MREPFPGLNWNPSLVTWEGGNGSGIWIGPMGSGVEISRNQFQRVTGAEVTLEGDGNFVSLSEGADTVVDRGQGNRVTRPTTNR